jgi:hypothetical protein
VQYEHTNVKVYVSYLGLIVDSHLCSSCCDAYDLRLRPKMGFS